MPQIVLQVVYDFWAVLCEMAPYLLLGFVVAGFLSVLVSAETVQRHLGGGGVGPIVKAAAFGIPLPLCSCGVIPVAASLRRHGASRAATTAFLIATPQDGADAVLVAVSLLGVPFAVCQALAALVSGVVGGLAVRAFGERDAAPAGEPHAPAPCQGACCESGGRGKVRRALAYGLGELPADIGRALLVGLLLAALITALVPEGGVLARVLGGGVPAMLIMMVLGIPVYVCATASIPVAAALIAKGVSPGVALVFLMTGPATNLATIATVWRTMGGRTAIVYLASVAGTALAAGLVLDYVLRFTGASTTPPEGWELPAAVKSAFAVVLLIVLGAGAIRARRRKLETRNSKLETNPKPETRNGPESRTCG